MPYDTPSTRRSLEDSLIDPPEEHATPRFGSQADTVRDAVLGDPNAIEKLFHYLGSANRDLRHIIQNTLHDVQDAATWQTLLPCLAVVGGMESWTDTGDSAAATWLRRQMMAARRHPQDSRYDFTQIERSLVEAFVLDESEGESKIKAAVLYEALAWKQLRAATGYLLGLRGDLRAIPILEEMVQSQAQKVAMWAIEALAALNDELCGRFSGSRHTRTPTPTSTRSTPTVPLRGRRTTTPTGRSRTPARGRCSPPSRSTSTRRVRPARSATGRAPGRAAAA